MASTNTLLTPTKIAREGLMQLKNNVVIGANVHREYKHEFVKVGASVTIRKPVKFVASDGATRVNQDISEPSTTLTIDGRKHVSWAFNSQELTLTIEEYAKRYIEPACIVLGNAVDVALAAEYYKIWYSAGTPGTTPRTFASLGDTATKLDDGSVPDDGNRKMILNPTARWAMADALKGIYDNSLPRDLVRKGLLGVLANFQIFGDQNVARHTTGNYGDNTALVNEASFASGDTTIDMDDFSNATPDVHAGDVFTIAGVNHVNPVSKEDTGVLAQFTVLAQKTGSSNAIAAVSYSPTIINTGAYQNVSALPADDAAITFLGTASTSYPQNLGFHRNALALVMCPLVLPESAGFKARVHDDGMSIRVVKDYDIAADEEIIRLDILYGTEAIYPDLGARLWG